MARVKPALFCVFYLSGIILCPRGFIDHNSSGSENLLSLGIKRQPVNCTLEQLGSLDDLNMEKCIPAKSPILSLHSNYSVMYTGCSCLSSDYWVSKHSVSDSALALLTVRAVVVPAQ